MRIPESRRGSMSVPTRGSSLITVATTSAAVSSVGQERVDGRARVLTNVLTGPRAPFLRLSGNVPVIPSVVGEKIDGERKIATRQ